MRAIWKFGLDTDKEVNTFEVPVGAKIVFVHTQDDIPTIWMELHPRSVTKEHRHFVAVGTGHEFDEGEHIGTVMQGPYVWHLFEVKKS